MSYVAIDVLTVPEGGGEVLEQRFAGRTGAVDRAPGFEHLELLRPVDGAVWAFEVVQSSEGMAW